MVRIRLVTRADDAGVAASVDRAVRAAVRQGIARNVSVLAPGPTLEHAARVLLDLRDTADFGLHVCLTAEWHGLRWGPISSPASVPSLLRPDGTFLHTCEDLAAQSPSVDEMMVEVEAQYDALVRIGFQLGYVDEHMGVGEVAGLAARLAEFAEERGLVYDRKLTETRSIAPLPGWNGPGEHPGMELADRLAAVPAGTYILVGHPGFKSDELESLALPGQPAGEVLTQRNRDRRMFADIEIVDYCETRRIELLRYTKIG
jgi:chitin disaccharide deacetylase